MCAHKEKERERKRDMYTQRERETTKITKDEKEREEREREREVLLGLLSNCRLVFPYQQIPNDRKDPLGNEQTKFVKFLRPKITSFKKSQFD
jgi:hypothetical protein